MMASSTSSWWHRLHILVLIYSLVSTVAATGTVRYCSSLNTGSTFTGVVDEFQSYGACFTTCDIDNDYAFAIIQGNECWCSDYAPGVTTDTDDCNETCPGYEDDICGADGLFAYYTMNKAVSGTIGASSSTAATTSTTPIPVTPEPALAQTKTVFITRSPAEPTSTEVPTVSITKTTSTTAASTPAVTTKDSSPTTTLNWTPTPVTSLETINSIVRTVTAIPSVSPAAAESSSVDVAGNSSGGGIGAKGIAGISIGTIALAALVFSGFFFLWRRKKRQLHKAEEERAANQEIEERKRSSTAGLRETSMGRTMSQGSRFVLGTNGKTLVGGFEPQPVERTGSGDRMSLQGFKDVDPRLDPFGVHYARSRESLNTINDHEDYSRKILRTTNPDPEI
ncbi:hypothetical protein BJ878DRAFT_217312 [Calycina marina]|uniref:WSC domain-containing protein n=1 Tax=Calycina marina TaxID=1763456 RepID=A0A9P7Z7V8_9HELO|nr:hypothetical protein BJ878DRAFT_217312 [Calycina marina]